VVVLGTGVCGKAAPAEIHLIPVHVPAGAVPILDSGVGVGCGVGLAEGCVDALGEEEGMAVAVGDGEAAATLHPETRLAAASTTSRPLSRPSRGP
jgi:hypothetical protein